MKCLNVLLEKMNTHDIETVDFGEQEKVIKKDFDDVTGVMAELQKKVIKNIMNKCLKLQSLERFVSHICLSLACILIFYLA